MADKDRKQPKGVRGPGGPPPSPKAAGASSTGRSGKAADSSARASLERVSYPLLVRMRQIPRWIMVILPAVLLFAGLVMPANVAWLGALLLALVGIFLAWLLLLSWPVISVNSRLLRLIVIVAVFGIAFFKAAGRL